MKKWAFLTIALGLWQLAMPLTFFHLSCSECAPFVISDCISGAVLIVLGILLSRSFFPVCAGWLVGFVGLWMQCSSLIFWTHSPLVYVNDTLVGAIAIVFCFQFAKNSYVTSTSVDYPRGWSYNPSAWNHRIPTVGLAMLCWFFARYMAAYQLGYITEIWDPFFPNGTLNVITSNVSKGFPVSDAGLGALCYTVEALLGWQGDERRWQTMPWLVFTFAFLVIPVGIVSITLIILQPIVVGAWCTWCLATALCMLIMIVLTAGEFAAALQFIKESHQRGESFWKVFWRGGLEIEAKGRQPLKKKAAWGISLSWSLIISALAGLFLMTLPSFLNLPHSLATNDYIEGPILFALSVIAMAEVFRTLRYCLALFGAWLVLSPLILAYRGEWAIFCHIFIGIWLIVQIGIKTPIKERYGSWQSWIH